jgi:hypothetical protein
VHSYYHLVPLIHSYCSSDLSTLVCFLVLPSVKLHTLHGSVVSIGVIVFLGLCNPSRRGCGEPAKPRLLYPLVWISYSGIVFTGVAKQSRLLNK